MCVSERRWIRESSVLLVAEQHVLIEPAVHVCCGCVAGERAWCVRVQRCGSTSNEVYKTQPVEFVCIWWFGAYIGGLWAVSWGAGHKHHAFRYHLSALVCRSTHLLDIPIRTLSPIITRVLENPRADDIAGGSSNAPLGREEPRVACHRKNVHSHCN